MNRRTIIMLYGISCGISSANTLPSAVPYVWNDIYSKMFESDPTISAKAYTTCLTFSIIPALIVWSPLIMYFKLNK